MSTYYYLHLILPTNLHPGEAERQARAAASITGHDPIADWDYVARIGPDLAFGNGAFDDPAAELVSKGFRADEGAVRILLFMSNLNYDDSEEINGIEVSLGRPRLSAFLRSLSQVTCASAGDIVGALAWEHSGMAAGPLVMTDKGMRWVPPGTDGYPGYDDKAPVEVGSHIPPHLVRVLDDQFAEIDRNALLARLAGPIIDHP